MVLRKKKTKYYSLEKILAKKAKYNIILGERSNGKTYAALEYAIKKWIEDGEQFAYIRRWREDFVGKRGQAIFNALITNGVISELTNGNYNTVFYYASKWYLMNIDEEGNKTRQEEPFAYGFSLTEMEHDKSASFPKITTVIFDEFLTRRTYLPDEFILFTNTLSTIIRDKDNVTVFMLGNTVNQYCPYFSEMGLKHIKEQKQGTIELYTYGDSNLTVAVEFCSATNEKEKKSNIYFAFDNPKLQMIKNGAWEMEMYAHCPIKIRPKDIVFTYFIIIEENILQCEVVCTNKMYFTFIHEKTTPLKQEDEDIIFCKKNDPRPNWRKDILMPYDQIGQRIAKFYKDNKVFYQNNMVGEMVRNFLINK